MKFLDNIKNKIVRSRFFRKASYFVKHYSLPGFEGIPIYNIFAFIYDELQKDDMVTRANSMAFSFFISFFPFLMIIFSVISLFPVENIQSVVSSLIHNILPQEAEDFILTLVEDVFSRSRTDILSISILLTLYFSSNGMEAMMRGFEKDYNLTFIPISALQRRLVAIKMTFLIGLLGLVSVLLIVALNIAINYLNNNAIMGDFEIFSFEVLRWILIFCILYSMISIIYRYAPRVRKKFSFFSPGTNFATLAILIVSIGFSYIANNFSNYNRFYGSLGTIIMILLWIQINCMILLMGFELNTSIAVNRDLVNERESNKEDANNELVAD